MPNYKPETKKARAILLAKSCIKNRLNQSAVAREQGVTHQAINQRFHNSIVQKTLAEYLKKSFNRKYIKTKFKDGLEADKAVGYLNNKIDDTKKVSDKFKFAEVPDLHCRHKYLVTLLECQEYIKHNGNGFKVDNSTHLHFTNINDQTLLEETKRRGLSIPETIRQRLNARITD